MADRIRPPASKPVHFVIDGQPFDTTELRQTANAVLRMADLDPTVFDLGELSSDRRVAETFAADEIVEIRQGAQFVSIPRDTDTA